MLRPLLLTMITLASAGCWGKTVVRVLNAETGEPIADARVSPIPEDIFGSPYYARAVATNENGYATLPYPGWRLYGDEVNHTEYREVHFHSKPSRDGDVRLRYMRPAPTVVLLLPAGFAGPLIVSSGSADVPYKSVYRIPIQPDLFQQTRVPGLDGWFVEASDIEAERDGQSIPRAPSHPDPAVVYLWDRLLGLYYEGDYVYLLFIGTAPEFRSFASRLSKTEIERTRTLTRPMLENLGTSAYIK